MTRLGHRQLEVLLSECGDRRRRIVQLVAELRLMSGGQIQRLLFTDGSTLAADQRHARRELAWLTDRRLLHRLERRIGGQRAGSEGTVYSLGPIGRRAVEFWDGHGLTRPSTTWEPGAPFVDHTLGVSSVYVELNGRAQAGEFEVLVWESEPVCWRTYVGPYGDRRELRPDAFVVTADSDYTYSWFVEFDRGTERIGTLRRKLQAYIDYAASRESTTRDRVSPHVLWIAPTSDRASRIESLADSMHGNCKVVAKTAEQAVDVLKGDAS